MSKSKFLFGIILCVLTITTIGMSAQENQNKSETLDARQQSLVVISALTATGDLEALKKQLNAGFESGLTINEIKELLVQLYAYCGFPRSLNAINTFTSVLEERMSKGITDKPGKEIIVENNVTDKYEQGRKVLEDLTKVPQKKPAPGFGEFAPRIDVFLKEHLFSDVFSSDVLSYQQRELITISALASMAGVDSQLQSHLNIGRNTGITESQLIEIADLIQKYVSKVQGNSIRRLLSKPLVRIIEPDLKVRISGIEILPEYLDQYNEILTEEASASVKLEPGVIAIFPMFQKETPTQIRIIEIYAGENAYQSHLKTPHFQHYKTTTLKMVKTLKLIDMQSLDTESMLGIFKKLK